MKLTRHRLVAASAAMTTAGALAVVGGGAAHAVSPAAFTTDVNGDAVNANLYADKGDVYLNGGPTSAQLAEGSYFFVVLEPGEQAHPDSVYLSSDLRSNRTFSVASDGTWTYAGTHSPGNENGLIQLMPFADTTNAGGVYIAAICKDVSDPKPSDCKYDAFKVGGGGTPPTTVNSVFDGYKYLDTPVSGSYPGYLRPGLTGLPGWTITIKGPGIPAAGHTEVTDADGHWAYDAPAVTAGDGTSSNVYTFCETLQTGWRQTGPVRTDDLGIIPTSAGVTPSLTGSPSTGDSCYSISIPDNVNGVVSDLDFFNVPQGSIDGEKYRDSNTMNGQFDGSSNEDGVGGWIINIYTWDGTIATFLKSVTTSSSGSIGLFSTTLDPGTYVVQEVQATNWLQTGNSTDQTFNKTGGATAALSNKAYTITIPGDEPSTISGLYFGNVCFANGGGLTLGFWSNKNGAKIINGDSGVSTFLNNLNLVRSDGSAFIWTSLSNFQSWLLNATSTNMAYMLSVQLATMELNVREGKVSGSALIYAPGTNSANSLGFATVNAVMAEANTELGLHNLTLSGSSYRAYQEALKNALDNANNNLNFLGTGTCPAPVFPS